jgi:citrate lyase beta subunit
METRAARFGEAFRLTLITNEPQLAADADRVGVNRVGIDLECMGKAARQAGCDTRLSGHGWEDLARIAPVVRNAELFVRINPIHAHTAREIETALELGARVLMLPSFRTADEVSEFIRIVGRRARVMILVELAPAVTRIREILAVPGIDEVMIGLNDLRLELGVANHFEVLASPLIDMLAAEVRRKGLPLGIGGVGRVDDASLPVPSDLVHAQYPRLGASGAWIARSFFKTQNRNVDFGRQVQAIRKRLNDWAQAPPDVLERAREDLARLAAAWR